MAGAELGGEHPREDGAEGVVDEIEFAADLADCEEYLPGRLGLAYEAIWVRSAGCDLHHLVSVSSELDLSARDGIVHVRGGSGAVQMSPCTSITGVSKPIVWFNIYLPRASPSFP